jgi:8-oxo-dGTP pyrophosphatase MutT (NUDIX family)
MVEDSVTQFMVPPEERDLHRVSTKVALYTPDYSHVMVTHTFPNTEKEWYGLPGGHVDEGEMPDETILREVKEELGITVSGLKHADFFVHKNGKIVLAYTGTLPFDTEMSPSDPAREIGVWLTKEEYENISTDPSYKKFVLENWHA